MAITFSKINLSGSTNGRPVVVTGVSATGQVIHISTSQVDEVWLYAHNNATYAARLTVEYGGTATGDNLTFDIPAVGAGPVLIVPGFLLTASLSARAYATVASVVALSGFVNRISVT